MNLKSFVAVAMSVSLLGGCAIYDNRTSADKFVYSQDESQTAVIILSAGAVQNCISASTRLKLLASTSLYNADVFAFLPVDGAAIKSEFSDHHGYLHVVRHNPGSYYFAPFIMNPYVMMTAASRADFSVSAGEVVYLGEYFLGQACGIQNSATFRDQSERDLALLKLKNPILASASIKKRLLKVTGQAPFK